MSNLQTRLAALSPDMRARLMAKLAALNSAPAVAPVPEPMEDDYSLSPAQWRMWLFEQREGSSTAYNIVSVLRVSGALDIDALDWALQQTLRRHESLRTAFVEEHGQVRRVVVDDARIELKIIEASQLADDSTQLEALVASVTAEPLPLGSAPLMRVTLLRIAPTDHALVSVLHHIAADGWSLRLLERDISRLYNERLAGRVREEPPHNVSYGNFVHRLRSREAAERVAEQLTFWERQLRGAPYRLNLPLDGPDQESRSLESRSHIMQFDPRLAVELRSFAQQHSVSLFMLLGAALNVVLAWVSGQDDISVGTPVANRRDSRFDDVVGLFSNTVVLRSRVARGLTFWQYLQEFKSTCLQALANQEVPFERVVEAMRAQRPFTNSPLFGVLFALHATESSALGMRGLHVTPVQLPRRFIDFEMMLEVFIDGAGGSAVLSARKDLFSESATQRLLECWMQLLERLARDPSEELRRACAAVAGVPTGASAIEPDALTLTFAGQLQAKVEALELRLQSASRAENTVLRANDCVEYHAALAAALRTNMRVLAADRDVSTSRLRRAAERFEYDVLVLHPDHAGDDEIAVSSRGAGTRLKTTGEILLLTSTEEARVDAAQVLARINFLQRSINLDPKAHCLGSTALPLDAALHVVLWLWASGRTAHIAGTEQLQELGATAAVLLPSEWREIVDAGRPPSSLEDVIVLADEIDAQSATRVHSLWAHPSHGPFLIRRAASNQTFSSRAMMAVNAVGEPLPSDIVGELAMVDSKDSGRHEFVPVGIRGKVTSGRVAVCRASPTAWIDGRHVDLRVVEQTLLTHAAVTDARVLTRVAADGVVHSVGYVAVNQPIEPEQLASAVQNTLGRTAVPTAFVRASSFTYTPDGSLMEELLVRSPVLDEDLQSRVRELCNERTPSISRELRQRSPVRLKISEEETASARPEEARSDQPGETPAVEAPPSLAAGPPLRELDEPATLVEMLCRTVARQGDKQIIHLFDTEGTEQRETYAELFARAQSTLSLLTAAGVHPGDRVLLQLPKNADMLRGFWACVLGGIVPITAAVPVQYDAQDKDGAKIINSWSTLDVRAVLTDSATQGSLDSWRRSLGLQRLVRVAIDARNVDRAPAKMHCPQPDDVALLLLTSGSTGKPKAVMQSHRALVGRSIATAQQHAFDHNVISLNWMPLDHVGGLVMYHLLDVYLGAEQVHCPSALILGAPLRWLDWLTRYRVTSTWAPNFAFALVNDRLADSEPGAWDFRALNFILNGGEAIVPRTARTFLRKLAPYGLSPTAMKPAWGMSETCSGITFNRNFILATGSDEDAFVEVGEPIPGVRVRIVDDRDRLVPQGKAGRLQVRGAPVTLGYFNNPDATRDSIGADGWFTTGDLAVMRGNSITITGREKDLIIINGLNYTGHELEQIVERVPGVLAAHVAACAVRTRHDDTDRLAVFLSVDDESKDRCAQICRAIRAALLQQARVHATYLIPLPADALPRTSIGKIQRAQLAQRFGAGEFVDQVWNGGTEAANEFPAWCFEPTWIRRNVREPLRDIRCVLVAGDSSGCSFFRKRLRAVDTRVIYAVSGDRFERGGVDEFTFRADEPEDLHRILSTLLDEGCRPDTVIHAMWEGASGTDEMRALQLSASSAIGVAQSLAIFQPRLPERCAFVLASAGAFSVDGAEATDPRAHAMLGMIRSLAQEMPWLTCRHLDMAVTTASVDTTALILSLRAQDKDDVVALRSSGRYVFRLRNVFSAETVRPRVFRGAAAYVITGGLGGIGTHLARYLLSSASDAAVLVLGRTPVEELSRTDGAQPKVKAAAYLELSGHGTRFRYECLDISNEAALRSAIDRTIELWRRPLTAAFHLAGEFTEALIGETDPKAFLSTAGAKIAGAVALARALDAHKETEVHLFSSANGYFGGLAAAAYATSNAWLDGFAAAQRNKGRRYYSYAWSMWNGVGMSRGYRLAHRTAARGFCLLTPEQGLMSMRLLAARPPGSALIGLDATNLHIAAHLLEPFRPLDSLTIRVEASADAQALRDLRTADRFGVSIAPDVRLGDQTIEGAQAGGDRVHAPLTEVASKLARLWSEILGKPVTHPDVNFFELGGDSIMAIQVVARANQLGLVLRPRQIFDTQTLGELATACAAADRSTLAEQGQLEGEVTLGPVQRWFFEQCFIAPEHMNQSVLLKMKRRVDKHCLAKALRTVLARHDMLRAQFSERHGSIVQTLSNDIDIAIAEDRMPYAGEVIDEGALAKTASIVQSGLDLSHAPLLRAVHFKALRPGHDRLLLVVHHLVIDGVSWRILLDDLESAYESIAGGTEPAPVPKTSSYRQWAQWCEHHAHTSVQDAEYWSAMSGVESGMLRASRHGANTRLHEDSVEFALDVGSTDRLLAEATARNAKVDHVLLGSLLAAWREWSTQESLYVTLEGHGRSEAAVELDLSRTVGWFTSIYPVLVRATDGSSLDALIEDVAGTLAGVPQQGMTYLMLRYCGPSDVRGQLARQPWPSVSFNYLGRFDVASERLFAFAQESPGQQTAPAQQRSHELDIIGCVIAGQLKCSLTFSSDRHNRAQMQQLAALFEQQLRAFVSMRRTVELLDVSSASAARIEALVRGDRAEPREIETIMPATAMQTGLLYESEVGRVEGAYVSQLINELEGQLDIAALRQAWQAIVDRHAAYRTAFLIEDSGRFVQVVHARATVPWIGIDWRGLGEAEIERRFTALLDDDARRGFDLRQPPLLRIHLIRTTDVRHRMLISEHHAVSDGWSRGVLLRELAILYRALRRRRPHSLHPAPPFKSYIRWLQGRDHALSRNYWSTYLSSMRPMPLLARQGSDIGKSFARLHETLSAELSAQVVAAARAQRTTVGAWLQTAWAAVLASHTAGDDVAFLTTHSGRPGNLANVESIAGPFVNTVPVRMRIEAKSTALDCAKRLQKHQVELMEHGHLALTEICRLAGGALPGELFNSLFVVENFPLAVPEREAEDELAVIGVRSLDRTEFPLSVMAVPGERIQLTFCYSEAAYSQAAVLQLSEHYMSALLHFSLHPHSVLLDQQWLPESERAAIRTCIDERAARLPASRPVARTGNDRANVAVVEF